MLRPLSDARTGFRAASKNRRTIWRPHESYSICIIAYPNSPANFVPSISKNPVSITFPRASYAEYEPAIPSLLRAGFPSTPKYEREISFRLTSNLALQLAYPNALRTNPPSTSRYFRSNSFPIAIVRDGGYAGWRSAYDGLSVETKKCALGFIAELIEFCSPSGMPVFDQRSVSFAIEKLALNFITSSIEF